jgi:hypothetical protein
VSLGPKWTQEIPRAGEPADAGEPEKPRRERTPYEGASVVFGAVIVLFGIWGGIETLVDGPGAASGAFVICVVFVLLGAGRVYLGLRAPSGD